MLSHGMKMPKVLQNRDVVATWGINEHILSKYLEPRTMAFFTVKWKVFIESIEALEVSPNKEIKQFNLD